MFTNISQIISVDPLVKLVQKENFVGWVYSIDYDQAKVMTNDDWKDKVLGIPHNCFLIATSFNPEEYHLTKEVEKQVLLLRVIGTCKLPQDDDLIQAKIDYYQNQTELFYSEEEFDKITKNQLQFGGLDCRVLGTFYKKDNSLYLGSDLESFYLSHRLSVYRPRKEALAQIVNHIDPLLKKRAVENAKSHGFEKILPPIQIGTVRYTSTDRLHRKNEEEKVPFTIFPYDFLARRTAVLGMTRTGKSNMIKKTVSVVKKIAKEGNVNVGQIIFDINGEYANANQQDKGSLADVYPKDTVRYRLLEKQGFKDLRYNFYLRIQEGFNLIKLELNRGNLVDSDYLRYFVNMSLEEPEFKEDPSSYKRWLTRKAVYCVLLHLADFKAPKNFKVYIAPNKEVRNAIKDKLSIDKIELKTYQEWNKGQTTYISMNLQDAHLWFKAVRELKDSLKSSSKEPWVDETLSNLLDMMVQKGKSNNFISGYKKLDIARKYHSPNRGNESVGEEIYKYLIEGKIVILDLSVGDPTIRETLSKEIASYIFNNSMGAFIKGDPPPNIVIYVEEAHNLIGKKEELTEIWPRIAKEGAKFGIAFVYATQEVSSIHPNILSNTENWFVTHLNNESEIKELIKFYDFKDFSRSLMKVQDVGFARVKTLSSPFVVPVQIDVFDPNLEKVD